MSKYTIRSICTDGVSIIGFELIDMEDKVKILRYNDVIQLIKSGSIKDCELVKYNDSEYIYNKYGLSSLNIINTNKLDDKLEIVDKVYDNEKIVGYTVINSSNNKYNISINKAWMLALAGSIKNASGLIKNNIKIISLSA